jgi:MFS family permease
MTLVKGPKAGLWTKDFITIFLTTFLVYLSFYVLMTTLTVYAIEEFSASESNAGLAASIFIIGSLIARLFTGRYMERIGRKRSILGGLSLFLLATLLYFAANSLGLLLLVRLIHGMAFGIATTAMATAVMDTIPTERWGEGIGYYTLSTTVATAIGPIIGISFFKWADFTMIFVVCTLFSVASIVISLFTEVHEAMTAREQSDSTKGFKIKDFFEAKAVPISIIIAIISFVFSGILSFLTVYTKEIGLLDATSLFFIVYALFLFISRPLSGRLFDIKGENVVTYPSLVLFAIGLLLISQSDDSLSLLLAAVLVGIGYGPIASCFQAIVVKESPVPRIGLATSTFFIFVDAGNGIGPFILGFMVPVVGFRGLYVILAIVVLACVMIYYLLHGKKAMQRKHHAGESPNKVLVKT